MRCAVSVLPLKKSIDKRSYYRALSKQYERSEKKEDYNDRCKPEFFPHFHIRPEFSH
jgi:hypothetical protein